MTVFLVEGPFYRDEGNKEVCTTLEVAKNFLKSMVGEANGKKCEGGWKWWLSPSDERMHCFGKRDHGAIVDVGGTVTRYEVIE